MSFRLNWTIKEFFNFKGLSAHKTILSSPWKFYLALLVKFIPGLYKKPIVFLLKNGSKIIIREFMSIYIYNEIFIEGCYDNLPINSKRPVVLEVGANTGMFVLRLKSAYPNAKIFSFEPYPPNYDALLETITINNIKDVTAIKKAVSDKPGKLKLFIHPGNIGGHSIYKENAGENHVEVETTTIEEIFTDNEIASCDVLKLDCEGAEYPILKSFTQRIADNVKVIIYEPTYSQYSVEELNCHLTKLGYNIKNQHGLIIASM